MCGIVGFINGGSKHELSEAVKAIHHRGPDSSDLQWFENTNSGLGHTRLSIIDLSSLGAQPMFDPVSGNWIVFNGEIYNYTDVKKELLLEGCEFRSESDTEVVLYAYRVWGEKCLDKFNGMFAFLVYNPTSGDVFAARDRVGIKPFYYLKQDKTFAFSSEIKAILELKAYRKEPDMQSIHTPAHFQISPYTGFKNILKLPAGHFLKFSPGEELSIHRYWKIEVAENEMSDSEAFERLDYLLNDAVRLNLISDIPVGAMLSGGLDSSIITALMQQKMTDSLNTFTIKFEKKDLKLQGNVDDSYYAQIMADKFGFTHHEIVLKPDVTSLLPKMVYHMDEPIADPAAINTYLISQAARERGITVLLNGMGADEVFSGYRSHLACLKADKYQKMFPKPVRWMMEGIVSKLPESNSKRNFKYVRWVKRFMEGGSLSQFERQLVLKNSALTRENFNQYYMNAMPYEESYYYKFQKELFDSVEASYLTKLCLLDSSYYMTDHNLTYSDKSMMAAGVEGRPTLLDHRIVELMFSLKPDKRVRDNIQKYLLKKVSEKYIPNEVIYRPKAPFSAPMRGWLKNELKEMVHDILSEETLKRRGVYNPQYVKQLISANEKGIEDHSQLIWRLMVNEIWFQTFFN